MKPQDLQASDFAKWVVENKPHLVEIEDEIQKIAQEFPQILE